MSPNLPIHGAHIQTGAATDAIKNVLKLFIPELILTNCLSCEIRCLAGAGIFHDTIENRVRHFVEQIRNDVPPEQIEGSGRDALAAQEIIESAILSHLQNGAVVNVKDIRQYVSQSG